MSPHATPDASPDPTPDAMKATVRRVFDPYERSHYWVLDGTRTALDGVIVALGNVGRPIEEQIRQQVANINARRALIGREPVEVVGF